MAKFLTSLNPGRPRQLLENILNRQVEICEAQRKAIGKTGYGKHELWAVGTTMRPFLQKLLKRNAVSRKRRARLTWIASELAGNGWATQPSRFFGLMRRAVENCTVCYNSEFIVN